MESEAKLLNAPFFNFEGPDGIGKTTLSAMLEERLVENEIPCIHIREPGGTKGAEAIREVLFSEEYDISPRAEFYGFQMARFDLAEKVTQAALTEGKTVISDRFAHSTFAYQIAGRFKRDPYWVKLFDMINSDLKNMGVWPTKTFVFGAPKEVIYERSPSLKNDRMETSTQIIRDVINEAFMELPKLHPNSCIYIDAIPSPKEILHEQILPIVKETLVTFGKREYADRL